MGSRRRAMLAALLLAFAMACTPRAPGPSGGSGNAVAPRPPAPNQQASPAQASSPAGPFPSPGAFVATTGCGRASPLAPGASADQQVDVDPAFQQGQPRRTYRLHVPGGYDAGTRLPVLLDLHGFGGSAQGEEQGSGYDGLADRMGFLAVYGQGLAGSRGAGWASTRPMDLGIDELGYFAVLLNQLQRQLCVDERRVYVTGFSNGGGMTEMLACYLTAALPPWRR